jgi:hypothetical protein
VAAEATLGVSLKTRSMSSAHCVRAHMFGDFMPNPFNSSSTGSGPGTGTELFDGGLGDAGTVNVSCNQSLPVAVWIIGRSTDCVNPV